MKELSRRGFLRAAGWGVGAWALGVAPAESSPSTGGVKGGNTEHRTPNTSIDPFQRNGIPRLRLSLAAYSFRDYLTGKASPAMTLSDFIDRAAGMDLDAVELTEYYFPKPVTSDYILKRKRQCCLLGLDISGSPLGCTLTHPPGEKRDKEIAHVTQWIDRAALLGAPCIRIFAGDKQPGQTLEEAQKNCIECMEICGERAAQQGVFLSLENHGGIVAEAEGLLTIIRAVRSEWCGINLDTGNFRTADPYGDMVKCAPYAVSVQVKTHIQPKGGPKRESDLKRVVQILKDAGYRGYVTLEYEEAEPMKMVPHYLAKLRELL